MLNIRPFTYLGFLETLAVLSNNGFIDKVKPRHVVLSSGEKLSVERFSTPTDFSRNIDMAELFTYRRNHYEYFKTNVRFINTGNLNYLKYRLLYEVSPNAVWSNTYKMKLTQDFFSVKNSNILLFYRDDVKHINRATPANIKKLNDNLNTMADMLAKKGITFHFMPCVDKYDLYSAYLSGNPFPQSAFFEELRKLPKRYHLIDTKAALMPALSRGEKDVFYPDDSHWSWKGSEIIFSTYRFP